MNANAGFNKLKDYYLFAHLTYCILTGTCLIGWLRATEMRLVGGYHFHFYWIFCIIAILALLPAQHKIINQTSFQDHRKLHLYKILYTGIICVIYTPIITGVFEAAGLSLITIVPVILTSIVCGTFYGISTALVMSTATMYVNFTAKGFNSILLTEQILLLALLGTTAWFIGQSFEYIINLYQQISTSDSYLKKTLSSLGIATLHVNHSGSIIHSNKRFEELVGINITEGMNLKEIAVKHLPFLQPVLVNLFENPGEINPMFGQVVDGRERLIPVQCIIYPISSGLGNNRGVLICILDISLSQRLEEEKILTNYFINFINTGIIMVDAAGEIIEMNRQAEYLLGTPKEDALNINLIYFLGQLAGKSPDLDITSGCEIELGDRSLLVNCAELGNNSGRITGSVYIINDISEHKELERKMHRSAILSAIGELAAGTAHEIRNPLTSIRGFLQLMQERKDERIGNMAGYFRLMLSEVDRINTIVTEFLKLTRPEKMEMQQVSLNEIIDSIWELMHNEAVLQDVKLSLFQDPGLPPVMGNADMIKQVVINLVKNAIQATGPQGKVRISTIRYKGGVRLSVEDNGPGIDDSLQSRIFVPYFTTRDEGTGLGLAITSKIVNCHNGSIFVTSSPDMGAKFSVDFPPVENN